MDQFSKYKEIEAAIGRRDFSSKLMHYTSIDALERILSSRELWFGQLSSMNDGDEGRLFLDGVRKSIHKLITQIDPTIIEKQILQLQDEMRTNTYISSWTEFHETNPDGRIGLWDRYAEKGSGIGIVIDSGQFVPSAITERHIDFWVNASKIEYIRAGTAIDHANELISRLLSMSWMSGALQDEVNASVMLIAKSTSIKHEGWQDEGEVRLIVQKKLREALGLNTPNNVTNILIGNQLEKSFFRLPLIDYPDHGLDLRVEKLLKQVVIGPSSNKVERADKVAQLLKRAGLHHVEVAISSINYIP